MLTTTDKVKRIIQSKDHSSLKILRELFTKFRIRGFDYRNEKRSKIDFAIWKNSDSFETTDFFYFHYRKSYFKIPKNEEIQKEKTLDKPGSIQENNENVGG